MSKNCEIEHFDSACTDLLFKFLQLLPWSVGAGICCWIGLLMVVFFGYLINYLPIDLFYLGCQRRDGSLWSVLDVLNKWTTLCTLNLFEIRFFVF